MLCCRRRQAKISRSILEVCEDGPGLQNFSNDISNISGRFYIQGQARITYNNEFGTFQTEGILPEFKQIQIINQVDGRYINELDIKEHRKTIVISTPIKNRV